MGKSLIVINKLENHGRWVTVFAVLGLVFAALPLRTASASATPQAALWITNGPVYSTALSGATLYVGGQFNYVGPNTGAGVTVNTISGVPNPFPVIAGQVRAAAPDGAGGWYVGGTFTDVDGSSTFSNLVHVIPQSPGSTKMIVDPAFAPVVSVTSPATASVDALLVSGTTLYVGGTFDSINDGTGAVTRNNIAAFDTASKQLIPAWDPNAQNGGVSAFALSSDGLTLYVGGAFDHIGSGGDARNGIAALDANVANSGAATAWDANAGVGTVVNTLLLSSGTGRLFIGGAFSSIGAQTRNNLAEVAGSDGSLITAWDPDANAAVNAMVLSTDGNFLFVGGAFNTTTLGTMAIGGKPRDYLAKVDTSSGAADDAWKPAADGVVRAIAALGGNSLMVGGDFTTIDGSKRLYIANIGTASGNVTTLDPSSEASVRVLQLAGSGGALFAGGDFISLGGAARNNLAALSTATGEATSWNPDIDDIVRAIAPSTTAIYIGGDFTAVGGHARNHLAAVDPVTAQSVAGWDVNVDATVNALILDGTTLYLGGAFTHVGSDTRNRLAAFDTTGIALTSWAPSVDNGSVKAMALFNDEAPMVYIGGDFTSVNGTTRNRLAALDDSGALITAWNPDVDTGSTVMALALSNVTDDDVTDTNDSNDVLPILYVGGDFTHIAGAASKYIAAIQTDINTEIATLVTWDPGANMANAPVHALALSPDNALLYAGGEFTAVGDQSSRVALSALIADNGDATSWDPQPSASGVVRALALTATGTLYAGGDFTRISGALRNGLAAFEPPTTKATPGGSSYNTTQNVVLSCTDKTSTVCTGNILYSIDGSVPSIAYTSGVQIPITNPGVTTTLKFYAADSEGMREGIKTESYIIDQSPPTVSASPRGGTYTAIQNIVLTCLDSGGSGCAGIYYTKDSTTPTTNSTLYTAAVSLDNNTDLKFIAVDGAGNSSPVMEEQFTIDAFAPVTTPTPPPLVSPASYTVPQLVTLSCDDKGGFGCAGTYYTTDGTTPTTASTPYTQPILINQNTTLNYFSIDKAGHSEAVTSAVYIIQTGIVVTSGGGLLLPPLYLLGAWGLFLGRIVYLRRRRA